MYMFIFLSSCKRTNACLGPRVWVGTRTYILLGPCSSKTLVLPTTVVGRLWFPFAMFLLTES